MRPSVVEMCCVVDCVCRSTSTVSSWDFASAAIASVSSRLLSDIGGGLLVFWEPVGHAAPFRERLPGFGLELVNRVANGVRVARPIQDAHVELPLCHRLGIV